jgi:L-ribulose-5-phosphate 3-epimerase
MALPPFLQFGDFSMKLNRRDFLATTAACGVGLMAGGRLEASEFSTKLLKAKIAPPSEETLKVWKAASFDGMETTSPAAYLKSEAEAAKDRLMAEKLGMKIHSVLFGWASFNSPNTSVVNGSIEKMEKSLHAAKGYGATTVLLVPCRVSGMAMPEPWEFDIEFDPKTGHVKRVVKGDNSKFADYIEAQNYATDSTKKAVEKLIPVAEKTGVIITLENVWNNLWVKPKLAANFIRSFDSQWVQAYYDIGNHVKYAPSEEWIYELGSLIKKMHVKDFKLKANGQGGKFVDIRDGSVNWPAVRGAIDDIGYNGYMTIEGSGGLSVEEQSRRLDLIIAGK